MLNKKRLFVTDSAFSHTATTNSVKQSSQAYRRKLLKQLLKVNSSGAKNSRDKSAQIDTFRAAILIHLFAAGRD